uniref:Uncharacterized protein n=1 Tax=Romanomermis culicivorax TaxID=13658 RepID=A0A915K4G9_ROMCU
MGLPAESELEDGRLNVYATELLEEEQQEEQLIEAASSSDKRKKLFEKN